MDTMLAELEAFQKVLCNGYDVWKIGDAFRSCTDIAYHFAIMLLEDGKAPEILEFSHGFDGFKVPDKYLYPVPYPGEKWSGHHVCACDGLAHDPILGRPAVLADYPCLAFGEGVPFKVYAGTLDIQKRRELMQNIRKTDVKSNQSNYV